MFLIADRLNGGVSARVRGPLGRLTRLAGKGAPVRSLLGFIGPETLAAPVPAMPFSLDWAFGLLLYEAVLVWVMRGAAHSSPWQEVLFWGGVPLFFLPMAGRAAWPGVADGERLFHLIVLALSTFLLKILFYPANFAAFDEFLHWVTANDILAAHRLFLPNAMLPVSPLFPGLELVTTAFVNLSGLSLFVAANLVVAVIRGMFIASLYGFYGRISGSYRLAAIGCLAYMGSSGYLLFDSQFAYETLAVGFLATILLAHAELAADAVGWRRSMLVLAPLCAAIVLTHHVTAIETLFLVIGVAVLQVLGRHARRRLELGVAAFFIGFLALWLHLIGNPLAGYLGPDLQAGAVQFAGMLKGMFGGHASAAPGTTRHAFVATDGTRPSLWLQGWMILSLAITALLLANGFFTSLAAARRTAAAGRGSQWRALAELLQLRWQGSWMLLVTLLALTWPVSILLRLTSAAGWQVGNRLSAFAFIGVGMVVGCSILRWWNRPHQPLAGAAAILALTVIFTGGVVAGWGVPATRSGYKVEGDGLSLEPMAIQASEWTKSWLGIGNRVASDRFNEILQATYGRQDVVSSLFEPEDPGLLFLEPALSNWDTEIINTDRIDYLVTDRRLSTALPYLGPYFNEATDTVPLDPQDLSKWDDAPGVSRIFDNGFIDIYDVRGLRHAP